LYDQFDDRYLGSRADNPTVDNDGNTLLEGALYWNSTAKVMRVWDGVIWKDIVIPDYGTAALVNTGTASGELIGTDEANDYYGLQYKPSVAPTMSSDFCANEHKLYEQYGLEPKTILQQWDVVRNSEATYFDANGVLQTAGINEPRIDYDPATGECRGLLVEGQRTNIQLYSRMQQGWEFTGYDEVYNAAIAPNGEMEALEVYYNGVTAINIRSYTAPSSTQMVFSIFFKNKNYSKDFVRFLVRNNTSGTNFIQGNFDLTDNSFPDGSPWRSESVGDGWYRIWFTTPIDMVTQGDILYFYLGETGSDIFLGAGSYYFWGCQAENGTEPSSLIYTAASAVTRVADIITPTV
jgi:hypothetical protein